VNLWSAAAGGSATGRSAAGGTDGPRPRSTSASLFRFCPECGNPLGAPSADSALSSANAPHVCSRCGFRQWRNPVVGVAGVIREKDLEGIVEPGSLEAVRAASAPYGRAPAVSAEGAAGDPGRILLGRRTSPRFPGWCIPCGYVEFDEEIREALAREIEEETGVRVLAGRFLAVHSNFHDPDRQSVGIWFEAIPTGGTLRPGDDIDALGLFRPGHLQLPIAFPTDVQVITALARGKF
jgi:8-oxo-dGTP diphosphatase